MKIRKTLAVIAAFAVMTGTATVVGTQVLPNMVASVSAATYTEGTTDELTYRIYEKDGYAAITACSGSVTGEFVIPSEISGLPVTTIFYDAFKGQTGMTSLVIPDSVTEITE